MAKIEVLYERRNEKIVDLRDPANTQVYNSINKAKKASRELTRGQPGILRAVMGPRTRPKVVRTYAQRIIKPRFYKPPAAAAPRLRPEIAKYLPKGE